ncbi:glycosyltransferase [Afipia sp. TerB]
MSRGETGSMTSSAPLSGLPGLSEQDRILCDVVERTMASLSADANVILLSADPISEELKAAFGKLGIDQVCLWHDCLKGSVPVTRAASSSTAFVLGSSRISGVSAVRFMLRNRVSRVICFSPRWSRPRQIGVARFLLSKLSQSVTGRIANLPFFRRRAILRSGIEWVAGMPMRRLKLSRFPARSDSHGGSILYATGSLGAGGSERQLVLTAKGMKRQLGRDVHIVTQSPLIGDRAFFADDVRKDAINLNALQSIYRSDEGRDDLGLAALNKAFPGDSAIADVIWCFVEKIRQVRPAVVHCWLDEVNVAAGIAAVICGVPRIVLGGRSLAPTNFSFHQSYMRSAYRELVSQSQVSLLNNSVAGARSYAEWLGIPESSIKVVVNGLELSGLHARTPMDAVGEGPSEGPVIGMVGRIAEEKRPFLWLDIARIVLQRRPDARFLWVGDGPMREAVVARAGEMGLSDRLSLPGATSNVAAAFGAMTLFLMTSRAEGLPNVSIEAQSFGIPVVIAAVGGAPETIEEGVTGLSVRGDRPEKFADAVVHFLDHPALASECRRIGPQSVAEKFSVERMIKSTIDLYRLDRP